MALARFNYLQFTITKNMGDDERKIRINKLLSSVNADVNLSRAKLEVITTLCDYANEKLVGISRYGTNANRYEMFSNIVKYLHLPNLIFLHHVEMNLNSISEFRSSLKDELLPVVKRFKRAQKRKHNVDTQYTIVGLTIAFCFMTRDISFLPLAFFALLADQITEYRINDQYEVVMDAPIADNRANIIGDGLDNVVSHFANYGRRQITWGLNVAMQQMNRMLPAQELQVEGRGNFPLQYQQRIENDEQPGARNFDLR